MNTTSGETYDLDPFEKFAPTLSQCFVIVIVGYLMARLEILSASDVRGVVAFASYFAMPGIICMSLADANFDDFRWELLFGIFLGKGITFLAVSGFVILLKGNVGVAGTVALFCAQSNDLPVGNPLMSSLYKNHRPQMMKYLFLIPAMTVITFLPMSNVMVSAHRAKRKVGSFHDENPTVKDCLRRCLRDKEYLNQMSAIAKNPAVLGLILNFVFGGHVPDVLHQPIQVAAATIPGIALAMLGFSFVRKERHLLSSVVVPASVLLILKMVLTPILLHSLVRLLTNGSESSKLLSDFSLLYGIISPATAVFQTGHEFRKSLAVMSVTLILTSFASFPVSYVVARTTMAPVRELGSYVFLLKTVLFWTACFSIFCDVVVWLAILCKNSCRRISCCSTAYLVFTQVATCAGVLVWILDTGSTLSTYCQVVLYCGGEISGYMWTATLALQLVLKERYFLMTEAGFPCLCYTAFGVSAAVTSVMCVMLAYGDVQSVYVFARPTTNLEYSQLAITHGLLSISLIIVAACLTYHFKTKKPQNRTTENWAAYENTVFYVQEREEMPKASNDQGSPTSLTAAGKLTESEEVKIYYDEIVRTCGAGGDQLSSVRRDWASQLSSLLILKGLTMLVRFISNLFKLADSNSLEVMIPLEFVQSVLFVVQGFFILLTNGVDVRTAVIQVRKWCSRMRRGTDVNGVANLKDAESKDGVAQFCSQFYDFYYGRCFGDIARERRWKGAVYGDSFWGHQLVDWMITAGLCHEDTAAEARGQELLAGGVIGHVSGNHRFYDAPHLYRFTRNKSQRTQK